MTAPPTEPLAGPDNAWWRMGDRTNLMEITAVLVFEDPVAYEDVVEALEERLLTFRRFRQRLVDRGPGRRPGWQLDPEFDVEAHVHRVALPEPQDTEEFQAFVGDLMSQPVDRTKPLWQAHLVEGAGPGNALVVRIHHAVADGFALLYVLFCLADDPSAINLPIGSMPPPPGRGARDAGGSSTGPDGDGDDRVDAGRDDEAGNRRDAGRDDEAGDRRDAGGDISPWDDDRTLGNRIRRAGGMAATAYRSLTMDDEPETSLVGDLGVQKGVAWTDPLPLERLKAAGRPHDATVNDVLLAAVAGAFRRHLEAHGDPVSGRSLRVTVPVNLKPIEDRTEELGNYFGLGFVDLPIDESDAERRLARIKANTSVLKQGTEAYLFYRLLDLFGRGPAPLQRAAMGLFRDKTTAVVTNVPGPTDSFQFCGVEVDDMLVWAPPANGVGLGISILSYDGTVRVGVAADRGILPEPFDLATAFEAEVEAITDGVDEEPEED